jgi:hypothetical protein
MKRGEEKEKEGSGSVGVLLVEVGSLCSKLGWLQNASDGVGCCYQLLCAGVHEPHKGVSVKKEEWLIVRKGA